ncbi:PEP-CTERM sorting domain-containing protein [Sphingomonas rhizophila]|uniref:PEP-CTERM sorting domain-containing protein n=1 Tax=Sphingomonas rhizophila TaxID=2071607 RepID=A0A7G9SCA3_9SPHN|nr:PEPxxWA-CTERM sorting domain-containing protein [Sphingomonas rhizophila]QNN65478.1 PEP-CTERM sorting domain-containing protein [Sphingomonas rhizophila]
MRIFLPFAAAAVACLASPATAQTLDFEGIANSTPVASYYAPNYIFSPATLALVDEDAGGTGNFANEPSANTIMFFLDTNNAILDVTNGFTTGFSFFYTSSTAATINVYDGLGGTGNILATLGVTAQHTNNCVGDPTGTFCNWTAVGVTFAGTAYSIDFGGTAGQTGYDNITFGSATPGGAVPEPGTWAMMLMGFGAVGFAMRRRRSTSGALQAA